MLKKIKIWIAMLVVILVSLIAFLGIFTKENGVWKNIITNYKYGMDLKGDRELIYSLSQEEKEKYVYVDEEGNIKGEVWKDGNSITEEDENSSDEKESETEDSEESSENKSSETESNDEVPYTKETRTIKENPDESLTKENFEQAKKIIQERFKKQGINEYNIRIDDVTGKLMIENKNDEDEIEMIGQLVSKPGKFKLIDYQNGIVLMDNSDIKSATVVYSNKDTFNTYLQIQFNKEGAKKLKDISNEYVEIKDEEENEEENKTEENSAEETSNEEEVSEESTEEQEEKETEKKYASVVFDDKTLMTTYFGEEMSSGILQIAVGQERTEHKEFLEDYNSAKKMADMINSGILPVVYEMETDNFVYSEVASIKDTTVKIVCAIVLIIISLLYIIKFKKNGVLGAVLNIGYIATLLLVLKYTNVQITNNGIIAAEIIIIINCIFMKMILNGLQKENIGQVYADVSKKFYLIIIPLMVMAIVFTLAEFYAINSIGMVMFWGIVLNVLYNLVFTKTVFNNIERKG